MRRKIETAHNVNLGTDSIQETYLIGVPHSSLAGDAVRGKFAEAQINVPVNKGYFEIVRAERSVRANPARSR